MSDWIDDRVGSALRGENPLVMARMRSGFAVIGDIQFLPGYSVLLTDNPRIEQLSDLARGDRQRFLFDMALLGEAIETCAGEALRRMNYSVYGNELAVLHAHVMPRYRWEPPEFSSGPAWSYPREQRTSPAHAYDEKRHGELRAAITAALQQLMQAAY